MASFGSAEADYPNLMAWVATINNRPAATRALATVNEVRAKTTAFDKAGDGAKDRLFGRGRYARSAAFPPQLARQARCCCGPSAPRAPIAAS
jgi:hypothetical protein